MGRSTTPTYRIEAREQINQAVTTHTSTWNFKLYGRPTKANLEKWRRGLNRSYQLGGVNEHVTKSLGVVPHVVSARVIKQSTGEVIASTVMPKFEVV